MEPPPLTGRQMLMGMKKIAIFDQYLASSSAVNGATMKCRRVPPDCGMLVTLIAAVCVQHSREL